LVEEKMAEIMKAAQVNDEGERFFCAVLQSKRAIFLEIPMLACILPARSRSFSVLSILTLFYRRQEAFGWQVQGSRFFSFF